MDFKQLVGLWYGCAALALAHIVFGVSGIAVVLCAALLLAVVIVQLALPHRSMRTERQFVAVGARVFVGQLVLVAALVAEWRACSGTNVAGVDQASGTLASPPGQTSTIVDEAIDETASVVTNGSKSAARFTRSLPHQSGPASVMPSTAIPRRSVSHDKRIQEPLDEPCQLSDDLEGSSPQDGQPVGCAREADDSAGRVRQAPPFKR